MITCSTEPQIGVVNLSGITPNGDGVVARTKPDTVPFPLRGGIAPISAGGIALTDTEAPFGVPLEYTTTVSNISSANRLVQQNLMLTPTFTHGVQGWTAGTGRTLTTPADSTAHSAAAVGQVTQNASITTPTAPPTLIGHKDTAVTVSGSYTLDPATPSGGGAIATNDWMLIVHTQLSLASNPADPSGWTRIDDVTANNHRQIIWKRKRQAGDTSYSVGASAGAQSLGSLLWVRGSGDTLTTSVTALPEQVGTSRNIATTTHAAIRPALVVSLFSASATIGQGAALGVTANIRADGGLSNVKTAVRGVQAVIGAGGQGSGPVAGATVNYMVNSVTLSPRTLIVATNSQAEASDTPVVSAIYGSALAMGFATQVAFQVADVLTNRIVAVAKAAAIPATTTDQPHLLTGRFKFLHPGLWTWQDVLNQGTWQNLKNTKTTWLDVRGSSSTVAGNFLRLFVTVVDPATGNDYIPPQQVITGLDVAVNTWIDFSMLFVNTAQIPSTAEIRLVHGSTTKEFSIQWSFDELGITPGSQRVHDTLYWFDGDTPVPANSPDYLLGAGWSTVTADAAITWSGTVGNSVSEFRTAGTLSTVTACQLDAPAGLVCEPVFLSDPTNVTLGIWAGLIDIGDLTRPANRGLFQVLSRQAPVAVSSARQWETTSLVVETGDLAARDQMNLVLDSGRVLLLRNPDPRYPETSWYVSIGDSSEARPIADQRQPERLWTLPITRVDRPTGLIEASGGVTWADVLAEGTWSNVLADHDNWLEVLTGEGV